MELRHLQTFLAVVEASGVTRAAQQLGYAQSSITAHIQALEDELDAPLFNRLGRRLLLTETGYRLLPYAQEMTRMHDIAKEAVQSESVLNGTVTLGAPESLAAFRLPGIIREFRNRYPEVKIILKPGVCWELHDRVRSGELDLVFTLQAETNTPDLHVIRLVEESMALIAAPNHPLAAVHPVEPVHLKNEVILQTEPGCTYRELFEQQLKSCGVYPNPGLEFWSIEAIKNCVMSGIGLSLLPLVSVRDEIREGKLAKLDWDDRPQRLTTQAAYHKKKWLSPALREFLRITEKHGEAWRAECQLPTS
ncbi:LysR family transcriptional regulator [Gorillibacterium massiliense]|uniref:LysR family transcriptional regulator n=1 Tax=Gorillibacterium massiliense TaxID=1280390 RepID=UPI0004B0AF0E|nr:LysR family transcriptional regulator [Gorillibacterium massiliense]